MRLLLLFISFSALFLSQINAKIVGIKDGDTVVALLDRNIQKTLRLAEVDCPESKQPFGNNAKQFTSSQIFGKNVIFYPTDTDRYGRTIAKIFYANDKYLSAEIIKAGLGWWYYQYSDNIELGKMQDIAKAEGLGLWNDNNPIYPYEWRQQQKKY